MDYCNEFKKLKSTALPQHTEYTLIDIKYKKKTNDLQHETRYDLHIILKRLLYLSIMFT